MKNKINLYWPWIPRNVEETVEKWLLTSCSVVLIRGHRRCGKSSTVKKVCERLKIKPIVVYIKANEAELIKECEARLKSSPITNIYQIYDALLARIKEGDIVILEEVQNCTDSLQVVLQQVCDTMAFEYMNSYKEWEQSGCLFLVGSLPGLVDNMIESRKHPLFERIHSKITIYSFDTSELMKLFHVLNITDKCLLLSLHTLFGGKPFPYFIANKAGLLNGNQTSLSALVKEFFASKLQHGFQDAVQNLEHQLGPSFAAAVKAVKLCKTKSDQIKRLKDDLGIKEHEAYSILFDDLYKRYGILKPVYSFKDLQSKKIECFEIHDPLTVLASTVSLHDPIFQRENVIREPMISQETIESLEGFHLECWIREIAEDRYLLLRQPSFPFLTSNDTCCFLPAVRWDLPELKEGTKSRVNVEIDLVASQPSTNTLIIASCKRSETKISQQGLLNHWALLNEPSNSTYKFAMLKFLKIGDSANMKVIFAHFVPKFSNENTSMKCNNNDTFVVTLGDMLEPFARSSTLHSDVLLTEKDDFIESPLHQQTKNLTVLVENKNYASINNNMVMVGALASLTMLVYVLFSKN